MSWGGQSIAYFADWIDQAKRQYKDKHILAFMDNLHKVKGGNEKIRELFRAATADLKAVSQSGRVSVVVTAELLKGADRKQPSLQDLMETGQIEHDATIGAVFHNDLQVDPGTDVFWIDNTEQDPADRKKPIAELRVLKNKNIDGAFKGVIKFEFDPKRSLFREISDDVVAAPAPQPGQPDGHYPKGQVEQGLLPGFKA